MALNMGLALMAAALCVGTGMHASRRLSRREELLTAWDGALARMEGAVNQGAGLPEVLKQGAGPLNREDREEHDVLRELSRRMNEKPAAPPDTLLDSLPWDSLLTFSEQETLQSCLQGLFSPTLSQQAQAAAACRTQWSLFCQRCRDRREKDGRLYLSLGWLGGAAAFILLC